MDMNTIGPLLVTDMKQRLITERRLGTFDGDVVAQGHYALEDIIEQIARCKTMSDINILLCNYHFLFNDEKNNVNPVLSVYGTQDYVIGLLTKRIAADKEMRNAYLVLQGLIDNEPVETRLGDSSDWDQLSRDNTNSSGHPADWSDCVNCGEIDLHLDEQCPNCGRQA